MPALPVGDHTVVGFLSGLEPRSNGWTRYSVTVPGDTYPQRFDTKKPEIVQAAAALMGQQVSCMVTVQDSGNPNPHQPGSNYMNRYLNALAPANGAVPQAQPQAQPAGTHQAQPQAQHVVPEHERTRQIRIMRQHCWEQAARLAASGMIPATPVDMVEAAEVEMAYIVYGPTRFGVQAFSTRTEETAPDLTPEPDMPEQQQMADPPPYSCPDCGTTDPSAHAADCIPF